MADVTEVTLFVVPNCPLCQHARDWLSEHGVEYAERDVTKDWGALRTMYEGTRSRLVPVLQVGDTFLVRPGRAELSRTFAKR